MATIEYDPNRSCRIALLNYRDGEKRYVLAPLGLQVGDVLESGPAPTSRSAAACRSRIFRSAPSSTTSSCGRDRAASSCGSAGVSAQLMAKEDEYSQVRMPSGEVRRIHIECRATIGQLGNIEHENQVIGKAGRSRHLGKRPSVRGIAMNPVDHPHGGGEARSTSGRPPTTPWGTMTMDKSPAEQAHR